MLIASDLAGHPTPDTTPSTEHLETAWSWLVRNGIVSIGGFRTAEIKKILQRGLPLEVRLAAAVVVLAVAYMAEGEDGWKTTDT